MMSRNRDKRKGTSRDSRALAVRNGDWSGLPCFLKVDVEMCRTCVQGPTRKVLTRTPPCDTRQLHLFPASYSTPAVLKGELPFIYRFDETKKIAELPIESTELDIHILVLTNHAYPRMCSGYICLWGMLGRHRLIIQSIFYGQTSKFLAVADV